MELLIDNENYSVLLYAYGVGFGKQVTYVLWTHKITKFIAL